MSNRVCRNSGSLGVKSEADKKLWRQRYLLSSEQRKKAFERKRTVLRKKYREWLRERASKGPRPRPEGATGGTGPTGVPTQPRPSQGPSTSLGSTRSKEEE